MTGRGEQKFGSITYSLIAEWTGLTINSVRSYAARGYFDPYDIEDTIQWVNARRQLSKDPLIGIHPYGEIEEDSLDT